jgi:hypothetical protein
MEPLNFFLLDGTPIHALNLPQYEKLIYMGECFDLSSQPQYNRFVTRAYELKTPEEVKEFLNK